jgi:hypothetical protein
MPLVGIHLAIKTGNMYALFLSDGRTLISMSAI